MGRKWLTTFAVVSIYVLASALVLAFAQGYTLDLKTETLVTTGVIDVASFPSQANVSVDAKMVTDKTPISLSRYLPGKYSVKIEKTGYQSVQINANVQSQLVTRFREVALWPQENNWHALNFSDPILSADSITASGLIMVHTKQEISWWQPTDETFTKVLALPINPSEISVCSHDGSACLVAGDDRAVLVDLLHKSYQVLAHSIDAHTIQQLFRFQNDYFVLVKIDQQIVLQKITQDGDFLPQMNLSNVDALALQGQEIWYVRAGVIYHRSLISGLTQVLLSIGNGTVIDQLMVNTRYIAWHTTENKVVLWDRNSEIQENTWLEAKLFADEDQFLVSSEAKIWAVTLAQGIQFIGQAPSTITTAHAYTNYSWLGTLADGRLLIVLLSPSSMYIADADTALVAVLPYQALVKWHDNVLDYHIYPIRKWLMLNT